MRSDKKKSSKPAAALVMCFLLMALVSVFAVKNSIDKVKDSMETADVIKHHAVEDTKKAAAQVVDSRDDLGKDSAKPETPSDYIMPVEGEVLMEYSMDMPIYWKTLDQYMTHNGLDIAAPAGTPVQSCAAGTVTKIEEHDTMGVTVHINHGNGLISIYSNLASDGLIELGEVVTQGQVIGKVGNSSLFEFESPDHLHFEMLLNNEHTDPGEYIK